MKSIEVDLTMQLLIAREDGNIAFKFDCVTGMVGHETTTGRFKITRKDQHYVSKKYKAPMPYAMFYYEKEGEAIHQCPKDKTFPTVRSAHLRELQDHKPVTDGSHGCVRLLSADVRKLWAWTPIDTEVYIH